MKVHELKIRPQYFDPVAEGVKTFEIRKDDRFYQVGDLLHLKEFEGEAFTGKSVIVEVTYTSAFNQEPGYLVMAIKKPTFEVLVEAFEYNKGALIFNGFPVNEVLSYTEEDAEAALEAMASFC